MGGKEGNSVYQASSLDLLAMRLTSEVVDDPSNIFDVCREPNLDMIHLVLFAGLVLNHYSSAHDQSCSIK